MLLDSCKKYLRKKIIKWLNLSVVVKFDDLEGNIQKLSVNKDDILLIESFHYYPKFKINQLSKYCNNVIYIPDQCKLKTINNVKNLKDIKKEFNQKINKLIIEKF